MHAHVVSGRPAVTQAAEMCDHGEKGKASHDWIQTESFDQHFDVLSLVKLVKLQGGRRHRSLLQKRAYREASRRALLRLASLSRALCCC
jgi:hypothetical protein